MLRFFKRLFFDENFNQKKAFLKSLDLFKDLTSREIGLLAQALHSRTYHAGETLFLEGDIGRALFILESGKVELSRREEQTGKSRLIYTIEPGEFFGEMALLEQLPRTASAVAAERSRLYLLYRSKLDNLLHYYPRVGVSIMSHLAQLLSARLRRASALSAKAADAVHG
ncbi:MAG: cyclic nucleotide-binding domain-containing protein [Elusimicrobia bacterium]|nr:cyclic nucleotide-binding domain-containing protein [Elusimicrobiota bacterium]